MTITPLRTGMALMAVVISSAAHSQGLDGLYQPSGASWSCLPDQIGIDGGALAVEGDVLNGVENRCELTASIAVGNGTSYTAVCFAEGSEYRDNLTLTPTANGLKLEREGTTVFWTRCGDHQDAIVVRSDAGQSSNSRWTFGGLQGFYESATRDADGNAIIFSCTDIGEQGSLYVDLDSRPVVGGPVTFDVDGRTFPMNALKDDGRIDTRCTSCGDTYVALWEATAAGNVLAINASDGRSALFNLHGSRDALGDVPCQPNTGD